MLIFKIYWKLSILNGYAVLEKIYLVNFLTFTKFLCNSSAVLKLQHNLCFALEIRGNQLGNLLFDSTKDIK